MFNYYRQPAAVFHDNQITDNTIGYVKWGYNSPYANRQDLSNGNCATCDNNTHLPNPVTLQTEQAEWQLWQQKLRDQQLFVGPPPPAAAPLPITLTGFAGLRTGAQVVATWQTTQEVNSAYFELEQSLTGTDFVMAGKVAAAGTSSGPRQYTLTVPAPAGDQLYLRLKMVDLDGSLRYGPVVSCNAVVSASALPGAARPTSPPVEQTLYTLLGQPLWQRPYRAPAELGPLAPGAYVLRTRHADGNYRSEKLLVR